MEFGFDHIHYVCKDVKAFADYFRNVFDAEIVRYDEDFKGSPNAAIRIGPLDDFRARHPAGREARFRRAGTGSGSGSFRVRRSGCGSRR